MGVKKLNPEGGALSMKFRTYTDHGDVALDATLEERAQLVEFIDKSLATKQVDYDSHSPVDFGALRDLREVIAAQSASDTEPLVLPRTGFWQLYGVASTWQFMGYDGVVEGVELDVSRSMVDNIRQVGLAAPTYIGPPEV